MDDIVGIIKKISGDRTVTDDDSLVKYSHDASVFEVKPKSAAKVRDAKEIAAIVKAVADAKKSSEDVSVSVRAAGTCMSGGSLTDSVLIDVGNLNKVKQITHNSATVEPGVYYRDFEKEIFAHALCYPPYTSSKLI